MISVNLNSVLLSYLYDCFALNEVVLLFFQICGSCSVNHTLNCAVEILLETDFPKKNNTNLILEMSTQYCSISIIATTTIISTSIITSLHLIINKFLINKHALFVHVS